MYGLFNSNGELVGTHETPAPGWFELPDYEAGKRFVLVDGEVSQVNVEVEPPELLKPKAESKRVLMTEAQMIRGLTEMLALLDGSIEVTEAQKQKILEGFGIQPSKK